MSRQSDLLRRPSINSGPLPVMNSPSGISPNSQRTAPIEKRDFYPPAPSPASATAMQHQSTWVLPPPASGASSHTLLAAIRPQNEAALQHAPQRQHPAASIPRANVDLGQKQSKVRRPPTVHLDMTLAKLARQVSHKQSPVPLPANFLAAMASSPTGTQSPRSGPAPASTGGQSGQSLAWEPIMQPSYHTPAQAAGLGCKPEANPAHAAKASGPAMPGPGLPSMSSASQHTISRPEKVPPLVEKPEASGVTSSGQQHAPRDSASSPAVQLQLRQEFSDVPGCESMKFVERMMENLKRASQRGDGSA